jgi:hypothetical protein
MLFIRKRAPGGMQTAGILSIRSGGGFSKLFSTDHHDFPALAPPGWQLAFSRSAGDANPIELVGNR